jgi:signal transduction histidine kinase
MPQAERPSFARQADEARSSGLVAVAARFLSTLDSADVACRIVEGARTLFGAARAALLVRDPGSRVLTGVTAIGVPDETLRAARVPVSPSRAAGRGAFDAAEHAGDAEFRAADFAELASIALENARTYRRVRLGTALAEGSRAARELHDTVLQELFAIGVRADELRRAGGGEAVQSIVELSQTASAEVRNAIEVLRTGKPGLVALAAALEQLADDVRQLSGIEIDVQVAAELGARSDEVAEVLYRVCAEALGNAEHHANATRCLVACTVEDDWAHAVVEYDGRGRTWHHGHIGLEFLREMVEALGGTLELRSLDRGEALAARIPLEPAPGLKI